MTLAQKNAVESMRKDGASYTIISRKLNVNINAVKSHCRRHGFGAEDIKKGIKHCKQCGKKLVLNKQRDKKFCSDPCRSTWWGKHRLEANYFAINPIQACRQCGKEFHNGGNRTRIYCSTACYGTSRRIVRE